MRIDNIQDDGQKFILYGAAELQNQLENVFSDVGLGISVTESDRGAANILYTENNRDIVLRILQDSIER